MSFLTVDATIGNQSFSHEGCNIFPGLSYNKANNTFLNSLRKNKVEGQLNLREKFWKGLGSHVIDVTVKTDSLLVYVLIFFGISAGRCGSVFYKGYERSEFEVQVLPWVAIFFQFLIERLSITGQKFSKCLKNGSDRLRKGQLLCRDAFVAC